jgi:hypothetical protein
VCILQNKRKSLLSWWWTQVAKLEVYARNLSGVQQLAGPWNSLENRPEMSERRKQRAAYHGERTEEEVICPKPRRATSVSGPLTEFMNPSRRRQR